MDLLARRDLVSRYGIDPKTVANYIPPSHYDKSNHRYPPEAYVFLGSVEWHVHLIWLDIFRFVHEIDFLFLYTLIEDDPIVSLHRYLKYLDGKQNMSSWPAKGEEFKVFVLHDDDGFGSYRVDTRIATGEERSMDDSDVIRIVENFQIEDTSPDEGIESEAYLERMSPSELCDYIIDTPGVFAHIAFKTRLLHPYSTTLRGRYQTEDNRDILFVDAILRNPCYLRVVKMQALRAFVERRQQRQLQSSGI